MKRMQALPYLVLLFALLTSMAFCQPAQAQKKVFTVGDRVLVSPSSLKDDKYWRPGTITEVHDYVPKKAYSVKCDPQNGGASTTFVVNEDWVKPLPAGTNVTQDHQPQTNVRTTPNHVENNNTIPGKVACPPSDPDSKGATAFEREIRGAIRRGFEREPALNSDGRVTITFQSINIGQSHNWERNVDPQAAQGKLVYDVRASFSTCSDYNTRIVLVKMERAFGCYKNTAGKWDCDVVAAANTNVKDESKSIDKPRR